MVIQRISDMAAIVEAAKSIILQSADVAIAARGRFTIALSGGSTPKALYRALATTPNIDWQRWWLLWGDERTVPPNHADSNYRMVRENLLDLIGVTPGMVLSPIAADFALLPADEQALDYELALQDAFEVPLPRIDLNLLGMGSDGHTASLFPFTTALHEQTRLVVANDVSKLNTNRITMTYPLINASRSIVLLVAGAEKAEALYEVLQGKLQPEKYPSQGIRRTQEVTWLVDEAAASKLTRD